MVAITKDINVKGMDRWYNGEESLVDSCGCDTLMDEDFARYSMRLPIHTDDSPAAKNPSVGVGGNQIFFNKYVITKCNIKGAVIDVKFYLAKHLPQ